MIGSTFGRLTILAQVPGRGNSRRWLCRCECGTTIEADTANLRRGATQSCGCLRRERWQHMLRGLCPCGAPLDTEARLCSACLAATQAAQRPAEPTPCRHEHVGVSFAYAGIARGRIVLVWRERCRACGELVFQGTVRALPELLAWACGREVEA